MQASEEIHFEGKQREEMYGWVTAILRQHQYRQQSREVKGLLRGYLAKMTGLSRAQMTRFIGGIARLSVESNGSQVTHFTTPFSVL